MHVVVVIVLIGLCYKFKAFSKWRQFHATLLYIIACDLLYHYFCGGYPLWVYHPDSLMPMQYGTDLIYTFFFLPLTALLFLVRFPPHENTFTKKLLYVLIWMGIYYAWEWTFFTFKRITYDNGWVLPWSIAFYAMMFPMLIIHHKKPLLAYPLSAAAIVFWIVLFKVPVQ
ncbi:CBO0543 family protein [Paenibacillus turpanensis]|uniref:CBO0543 family protein n=1 Tax=Paenibacillus turpanensis TaxID=2689078 RepID=UPI0014079172|nr:CBO0543 family protein [Paenibacillus turpanensis]